MKYTITAIAGWSDIRSRILQRDHNACRICGSKAIKGLNVHHKDWVRSHNENSNLVTLCPNCHKGVHLEGYKPDEFEDWPIPWGNDPE